MNKLISLTLFCAFSFSAFGQVTVNGVDINTLENVLFIELSVRPKQLSTKVVIGVDYGQKLRLNETQNILGPGRKLMEFESAVAALNFMCTNGWEYVNSYPNLIENQGVYLYLLKRKE